MGLSKEARERVMTPQRSLPENIVVSDRYKDLSVAFLVADHSACGYYRAINPGHMLKMLGAKVVYKSAHSMQAIKDHDYIIAPRQHNRPVLEVLFEELFKTQKLVVFELDDDLDHLDPTNPAYTTYYNGSDALINLRKFVEMTHGMTTTTDGIRKQYSRYNNNIEIVENMIDYSFRDWGADVQWVDGEPIITPLELVRPPEWDGKIVVGWSGGSSHALDLEILGPAMRKILNSREDVIFAFYGVEQNLDDIVRKYNIPREKISYVYARHFLDYPAGLHGFDISLAPLERNQFNLCKSPLRLKENLALGITPVATDFASYAEFNTKHPGHCIMVGKGPHCHAATWTDGILSAIENVELRNRNKTEGRTLIAEQYSLEKRIHEWPESWKRIKAKRDAGLTGVSKETLTKPVKDYTKFGSIKPNDNCPCGSGKKYKVCHVDSWG